MKMKRIRPGCLVVLSIFGLTAIVIIGICIWGTTPAAKAVREKNAAASALAIVSEQAEIKRKAVLDVTQFAEIKPDKLIKIMGKPSKVYKEKGDNADTYYDYSNSKYWCEFTVTDNAVKKLEINSQKYYSGKGKDFTFYDTEEENLKAFGVVPKYQYTEKYTGLAMNLYDGITDAISGMNYQFIDQEKKTFQYLFVTYF
jgi:hypothetical protein